MIWKESASMEGACVCLGLVVVVVVVGSFSEEPD